jgi:menaquinone-dependent protoporphyrinogen oxidase
MKNKILVTYASRAGSTQGVAQAIGEVLVRYDADVDLRYILDVKEITDYSGIIIGSPLRTGHWLPEAIQFVHIHQQQLLKRKVAYFVVCMTLHEYTPENCQKVLSTLNPVCKWVEPMDIGLFAGALKIQKLKFFWRLIAKFSGLPEGDFRNFEAIREWAEHLANELT